MCCAMQCKKGRGRVELPQQHHPGGSAAAEGHPNLPGCAVPRLIAERTQQLRPCIPTHGVWGHTMVVRRSVAPCKSCQARMGIVQTTRATNRINLQPLGYADTPDFSLVCLSASLTTYSWLKSSCQANHHHCCCCSWPRASRHPLRLHNRSILADTKLIQSSLRPFSGSTGHHGVACRLHPYANALDTTRSVQDAL
jgi:hypothetical protein